MIIRPYVCRDGHTINGTADAVRGLAGSVFVFQSFIRFLADLMNRPKALSFLRLSRYDISWYSDSFLSLR